MMKHYGLFIGGEFRAAKEKKSVVDPSSQDVIAEVSQASVEDAEDALCAARRAFDNGPWRSTTLKQRSEYLRKISEGILDKAAELAELETRNTGKPIKESTFMDIPSSARSFEYLADNLEDFLADERIAIDKPFKSEALLRREPRGVAVLIVPWNYPLLIASWKLASALAAGNTVILKPSTLTPLSALELGSIIKDAGVPDGVVNILAGSGSVIGEKLCRERSVDMISFTGSNPVGKKILSYTEDNVKKLILELGGKSASIVCQDADFDAAVNGSLCSIFLNQGQMCTAMSRIFVQEPVYDDFIRAFTEKARRIRLGQGRDFQTQMGPLISEEHRRSVCDFVRKAQSEGARVLCGGAIPALAHAPRGFFFEPTLLADVSEDMEIFHREVFGPVAIVKPFKDIDEASRLANMSEYALAGSIWSCDSDKARALAQRLNAGIIWINTYGMFFNELPYGGFKQSGFGKELGREGLYEYTRLKNILTDTGEEGKPLVNYWYGF